MNGILITVCTFNHRVWRDELDNLPVMKELADTVFENTYTSATWTWPGTNGVMMGRPMWMLKDTDFPGVEGLGFFNASNLDWNYAPIETGIDAPKRIVNEWDRTQPAFMFVKLMHHPYGGELGKVNTLINREDTEALEEIYRERLHYLDDVLEPLLDIECPIIITGDHGEDFGSGDIAHLHHGNFSKENIRVPMFGRNLPATPSYQQYSNLDAKRIMDGDPLVHSGHVEIFSEGPFKNEWGYYSSVYGYRELLMNSDGVKIKNSMGQEINRPEMDSLYDRMEALGYCS